MPNERPIYAIDFETYYDDECSVKTLGPVSYTKHPKFQAYWLSVWGDQFAYSGPPEKFDWSWLDGATWITHNAGFDMACFSWCIKKFNLSITPMLVEDTTGLVTFLGAPRYLAGAVKQLLGVEVDKTVRAAMKGKLPKDLNKEEYKALEIYALHDVEYTYSLWMKYSDQWPEDERRLARLAWMRGADGLPIDNFKLGKALADLMIKQKQVEQELPWVVKGAKPSSPKALKEACLEIGIPPPVSTSEDDSRCQKWLEEYGHKIPWVSSMSRWRKINNLLKKIQTIMARMDTYKPRVPYSLKYYGAHTGRWSGDAGFNVQALQRDPVEGVSMRSLISAPEGKSLITADLAQIEPRCLAWLCGDQRLLDLLKDGHPLYQAHAEETMNWHGKNLKKENPELYKLAKARVLGLGYGCGAERFVQAAKNLAGVDLSLKEAKQQVNDFREKNPRILHIWNTLESSFKQAALKKQPVFEIELPSGRKLRYFNPKMKAGQLVAQVEMGGMEKFFWGGKLCENLVQATARDVLAHIILRLENAGFPVLFHVHDDVCLEVNKNVDAKSILPMLTETPPWLAGCPLEVEIKEGQTYDG